MIPSRLVGRWSGFKADLRGSTAILFGLSVVPILMLVAAGIDYSRAIDQKEQLQDSTDATALAMTRLYQTSPTSVTTAQAQIFLSGAVHDKNAVIVSGPTVTNTTTSTALCITTKTTLSATMMQVAVGMGFMPPSTLTVSGYSCTKMDQTVEVALVLDTSGSMNDTVGGVAKIKSLRDAANGLVSVMIPSGTANPRAAISIVPFSLAVNVGSNYQNASWIDSGGISSIALQNYRVPKQLPTGAFAPNDRFDLFSAMGQSWGGCVEERSGSYLLSDAAASTAAPDSLFEPYLYPDEYSTSSTNSNTLTNQYLETNYGFSAVNDYLNTKTGSHSMCDAVSTNYSAADQKNSTTPVVSDDGNPTLPRGDSQTMVCKYVNNPKKASNFKSYSYGGQNSGFATGPNLLCDSQALTTMTNDTSVLGTKINALVAKGSTNLISGVMWGWRTVSPNGPFNTQTTAKGAIGPQNARQYTSSTVETNNKKYMVLVTDGMNSWNANTTTTYGYNQSTYSPFGFFENGRLGTTNSSNWRSVMDTATLQACTNMKNAGVKIFTIGFSTASDPIDSDGKSVLQQCATSTDMAYFAADGSSLISTFQSIAQQMSTLRLTN